MSASPDKLRPAISILIPETFEDARSDVAFLRDWVGQSCEETFEVIVVATPGRPDFEDTVRRILRPQDQYIVAELSHEMEGYAFGADAARGEWLFITENHVRPDVNCLRQVLAFLADGSTDAGVVSSASIHRTKIARAEGNCFVWQTHDSRRQHPDNQPLQLRGFVLRRDVFLRHGGLPAKYKFYALAVLGFRMAKAGLRVRRIEKALIHHVGCTTFHTFTTDVRDTTLGECIFAHERRPQCETPTAIRWTRGCNWRNVRALLLTAAFPGRRLRPRRRMRVTICLLREAVNHVCNGSFATRLRWIAACVACLWSRGRFALTRPDSDAELVQFIRMWKRIVAAVRLDYATHAAPHALTGGYAKTEMAAMQNNQMDGFHELESHAGQIFRWSHPLAEIVVAIPAAPHRFTIDTQRLRGDVEDLVCELFVNGRRVPSDGVTIDQGVIAFKTPGDWIFPGNPTRITILTEPLQEPRRSDGQKGRRLGLPFVDFRAEAI